MELFCLVGGGVGGGGAGTNELAEEGQSAIGKTAAVDEEALLFRLAITAAVTCCWSHCMSHTSKCRAVIGPCAFPSIRLW